MTPTGRIPKELTRLKRPALLAALGGAVVMVIALLIFPLREQFFRAYFFAWLFILGLSLGSLAIVMLNHLVPGEWGWLLRRMGEAAAMNLPLVAILFIPVLLGLRHLFPWADAALVAGDPILQHKAPYLNTSFFLLRAAVYFIIWIALAMTIRYLSLASDRTGDARPLRLAQRVSAAGVVLYIVTMSLAAVDWILSRDAHWFSTIIGLIVVVGQAATGMAFLVFMGTKITNREPLASVIEPHHLNDWGNLLLTLVILWAYMSFAQMLIIWMGNVQEDVSWYVQRGVSPNHPNGWRWFALFLVSFHFFVPFFILLSRDNKRRARSLYGIAALILFMRMLDVLWWVAPTTPKDSTRAGSISWLDIPALMMLGGIWLAAWLWQLQGRPLLANAVANQMRENRDAAHAAHQQVAHA